MEALPELEGGLWIPPQHLSHGCSLMHGHSLTGVAQRLVVNTLHGSLSLDRCLMGIVGIFGRELLVATNALTC
jgi:hypothetical protein